MPNSRGESRERKLSSTLPRVDRLFSPQYSMTQLATSSKMRWPFFLFSSKEIPPFLIDAAPGRRILRQRILLPGRAGEKNGIK